MCKNITRVIAGLGIVAGIGLSALPLSSYAASPDVIISVTVGDSGAGTPDCTGTECFIPGTNNPNGQTLTLADKDGAKFALANIADTPDHSGADQSTITTRMIPTIATEMNPITKDAGYGVMVEITGDGAAGYTDILPATAVTLYQPVSATIATIKSEDVTHDSTFEVLHTESYVSATETGTYTNTLTFTSAVNTP